MRLAAVLGAPWGRDQQQARLMAAEWEQLLADLPAVTIDKAVTQWLTAETKWPKPADIRELAGAMVGKRVTEVSESRGIHEARLNPSEHMKGLTFRRSMLRLNPTWAQFLDSVHPTAEHCFFASLVMGEFAHELKNATEFEADYIREKYGDRLTKAFCRPVTLRNLRRATGND